MINSCNYICREQVFFNRCLFDNDNAYQHCRASCRASSVFYFTTDPAVCYWTIVSDTGWRLASF